MKRLSIYLIGLLITTAPTVIFIIISLSTLEVILNSGGRFYVDLSQGYIDISDGHHGVLLYPMLIVPVTILSIAFMFFLVMLLREVRTQRITPNTPRSTTVLSSASSNLPEYSPSRNAKPRSEFLLL